jgi:hypothetical protein
MAYILNEVTFRTNNTDDGMKILCRGKEQSRNTLHSDNLNILMLDYKLKNYIKRRSAF